MRLTTTSFAAALLATPLLGTSPAEAGRTGKGSSGGGGGALGRVSAGISRATHPASSTSSSRDERRDEEGSDDCLDRDGRPRDEGPFECPRRDSESLAITGSAPGAASARGATAQLYAGAQAVYDSEGSVTLEVAVRDGRLGVMGGLTHHFETKPDGRRLTMSMPKLLASVRIDDRGRTAVFLEGGVVHVGTRGDEMADSSITGAIAGMRLEHQISPRVWLLGDVQRMWFPHEVEAQAGRVGVRLGHVQASLRVLDFNVGPPLFGPEVGVRF